uniref:C2H2-type domain-containing protein n=1 Tax=Lutzomyia longipalpis TaxID=7200 RepID=A0A1B0CTC7_LUTLO
MFKSISKIKRKESALHMRDVVSGKKKPVEKTERPKGTGRRGRKPKQQNISPAESSSDDEPLASRSGRKIKKTNYAEDDDFDDDLPLNAIKGTSPVKGKNGGDSIEFINIERIGESDGSSEDETSGKADKSSASSSKKKSPDKTAAVPHIVKTSGGVTVYQCSKCPKTYERPSRLRRHFRKHTGDVRVRWYNCNICNKQFSTEDKLNKHLVRRHEDRVTTLDAVAVRNAAASAEAAQAAARARALAKIAQEESGNDLVSIFDEESPIKMETVQVKVERTDTYDSYDEDLPLAEAIEPKMEVDALATTVKHEDYNDRSFGDDFDDNFDNNFDDHFANDDVDVLDDVEDDGDKYQTTKTGNTIRIDYKVKEHYSTAIDEFEEKLPMVGDDSGSEIVDCSPLGRDAHDFLAETEIESLSPMSGEEEEDQDGKKSRFYKCSYCPRTFVVRENFADHMAYHTKKEKPFPCEQCDEEFLTQGTLHYHIESKHLKPRCEVCNERVGNLKDFLMHQKRHTKRIRYKTSRKEYAKGVAH